MNCYFCHTCEKEFYLNKNEIPDEILCKYCGLEFVEEIELTGNKTQPEQNLTVPEKDYDSAGNEFLSCHSKENEADEEEWEDESEEED